MPPVPYPRSWSANDFGQNTVIVGNRSEISPNTLSSGSNQTSTYRIRRFSLANANVTAPRLVFANMGIGTSGEALPADAWTVKATLELADGRLFPVFFNGSRTITVQPGAHVTSDPVGVVIPAGSHYFVRTFVSVAAAGQKWVTAGTMFTGLGEGFVGNVDHTDTATASLPAMGSAATFGPVAVIGTTGARIPNVAIVGSSSAAGQGDTNEGPYWDLGYLSRILSINVPTLRLGRASDTIAQFLAVNRFRLQLMAATGISHVIFQSGSNDLANGGSVADVKALLTQTWELLDGIGFKVIQSTLTQTSTSTDAFVTEANQTAKADAYRREEVNAWIRTCPGPLHGVVDPAAITAGRSNPLVFRADGGAWTTDGTHLTPYGHREVAKLMAAELLNIIH